jgi:hypothetical protein
MCICKLNVSPVTHSFQLADLLKDYHWIVLGLFDAKIMLKIDKVPNQDER